MVFFLDASSRCSFLCRQCTKFWKSLHLIRQQYLSFPLLTEEQGCIHVLKQSLECIFFVPNFFFSHESIPTWLWQTKNCLLKKNILATVVILQEKKKRHKMKNNWKSTTLLLVKRSCSWMVDIIRKLCGGSQQLDKLQALSSTALPHVLLSLNKPRDVSEGDWRLRLKSESRTKLHFAPQRPLLKTSCLFVLPENSMLLQLQYSSE